MANAAKETLPPHRGRVPRKQVPECVEGKACCRATHTSSHVTAVLGGQNHAHYYTTRPQQQPIHA
jgi:hypothetical protein